MSKTARNFVKHTTLYIIAVFIGLYVGFQATELLSQENSAVSSRKRAPRTESEQMNIDAYKKARDTVVNINSEREAMDSFGVIHEQGSGSGVIIDAGRGLIVTNHHVIADGSRLAVTLADGQSYGVRVAGSDADNDLAILQIKDPPKDLVAVEMGTSSSLEVGQQVLAIGNPFGLERTLTVGIVSSLGRSIRTENGRLIEDIIQTDAAINPGNSGGPLLDTAGRLVGINTAIVSKTGENSGIGFAIPVDKIRDAIPQLVEHGRMLRPKLGVIIADTDYGPVLLYVHPGSPADRAGLQGARKYIERGFFSGYTVDISDADFLLAVQGKEIKTKSDIMDALGKAKEGQEIELLVRRGLRKGTLRRVKLKLELG